MNGSNILRALALIVAASVICGNSINSSSAEDWPGWRGASRDGLSKETGLLNEWAEGGPKVAWQVETVGVGYSSIAVAGGRIFTQGDLDGVEHIICLNEKDGTLLWAVQPEPIANALDELVASRFEAFDKNADGKLDEIEALNGLGWNFNQNDTTSDGDKAEIAEARVKFLFAQLDGNQDGLLAFAEMPRGMQDQLSRIDVEDKSADGIELAKQRAETLLKAADKDDDSRVSRDEARNTLLARLYGRMDKKDPGTNKGDGLLTLDEIREYFFAREPGRDGNLSKRELSDYFQRTYPGRDGVLHKADVRRNYGGYRNGQGNGPRGTPTVDGNYVYAEGGNGDLTCLDAATGKTIWHVSLTKDLGGGRPGWGYCESPLIHGDQVIVTPGGKQGTIAALDKKTGEVLWRSAGLTESAHYSSPQVTTIAGVKQIVQFGRSSVFGVTTDGSSLLWSYSGANNGTANVATPIVANDQVLASSGYGTGTGLVKVLASDSTKQDAKEVYFQKKVANHHGGLIKVGDHVYGFGGGLVCMDFATGEVVWKARSVGKGSLVFADGMLYCLGERYEVALVEASPGEYRERGRFKIESLGRPSWAHPVVANGRFYIRNQQRLTAYDVKGK